MKKEILRKRSLKKRFLNKGIFKKINMKAIASIGQGAVFSISAFITALTFFISMLSQNVFASSLQSSKFVTGTVKMLEDATNVLIVLAPVLTIFVVGYCFIRKSAADEMDYKKWATRITTAIVCCIGVVSASIIVKVVMDYYK